MEPRSAPFALWRFLALCIALCMGALGAGCGGGATATTFEFPAASYSEAFDAARDVLREQGFELDRVDARSGMITTAPRASAGLATPWIPHNPTMGEAINATIHPDRRMAVVSFTPLGSASVPDLREHEGTMLATVQAPALRLRRVGRHLDSTAIRFANWWRDPTEPEPMVLTPVGSSDELASELAERIRERVAGEAP